MSEAAPTGRDLLSRDAAIGCEVDHPAAATASTGSLRTTTVVATL
jgi:hypothetical protein